jgi:hypothetical protein
VWGLQLMISLEPLEHWVLMDLNHAKIMNISSTKPPVVVSVAAAGASIVAQLVNGGAVSWIPADGRRQLFC